MIKNPFAGKSARTKIFAIITLAAVVLLLALNLLAFSMGIFDTVFLDLTPEGLYSVREVMFDACHDIFYMEDGSLREPGIEITFCADRDTLIDNYSSRPIYYMALDLAKKFPNLTVNTVNVIYNPTAVAAYKTTSLADITPNDVIISYGSRYRVVSCDSFWRISNKAYYSFDGEYKLATILLSLTLINQPSAYFVTDHGEDVYNFEDTSDKNNAKVGYFIDLLRERGLNVKNISLKELIEKADEHNKKHPEDKVLPTLPEDCALVVINNPKSDFRFDESRGTEFDYVSECEILDRFLTSSKGSVMVSKDYKTELPILEDFLFEWGIELSNTLVKDDTQYIVTEGAELGTSIVTEYNSDENSYAYQVYGEYANLDSAPRVVVTDSGHITCSYGDSDAIGEPGSLNVSRIFAPFIFTSEAAKDYAYSDLSGAYSDLAGGAGQKTVAALSGRQSINNVTSELEYSYLFCAASGDFFSSELLGNAAFANYDISSALVQNIARLDTYASMELGGISGNNYTGFGGKVLESLAMSEEDETVYAYDVTGKVHVARVNKGLSSGAKIAYACIAAAIPLAIAAVGIIVKIKRRYL